MPIDFSDAIDPNAPWNRRRSKVGILLLEAANGHPCTDAEFAREAGAAMINSAAALARRAAASMRETTAVCIACGKAVIDGNLFYEDMNEGPMHAECCGPERESFVGPDGEPLKPGDPIAAPCVYRGIPARAQTETTAEQFIQAAIDSAPEPLRRLGEYLTRVLDEDEWATAERMLLAVASVIKLPPGPR